mgnify:CR=1 FL=1
MADKAREWTDKTIKQMEREISDIYAEAVDDITKKWDAYMKEGNKDLEKLYDAYKNASPDNKTKAEKAYKNAVKELTLQNDSYKEMLNETTLRLANANKVALAYANNQIPDIYAKNYAQIGEDLKDLNVNFVGKSGEGIRKIVNEDTVKRRIVDGDVTTPFMRTKKYLNISKDQRWNTKQINSSVLQGILQGESMDKIANRILPIVGNNESASIRNARTIVTGAENAGRQDSYERLEEEGIVMKKVWIATGDERTRESHLELDGQEVDINEPFITTNHDGSKAEIDYPGDPSADAEQVYNCRCSMKTHIIGFRKADGSISEVHYYSEGVSLHEQQIEAEKERRQAQEQKAEPAPATTVVNGTDISQTWERRPDQFDFEIEDVINAQGFDGVPRVVSAEEFDRYVQAANDGNGFIAQRTYSAPDQETLDMYRDQLYNGKWYVDCSTGGAQYGQGMYCAADYSGTLSNGIKAEMEHYQELNVTRGNKYAYIETLTLDPSSKITTYTDINSAKIIEQVEMRKEIENSFFNVFVKENELHENEAKWLRLANKYGQTNEERQWTINYWGKLMKGGTTESGLTGSDMEELRQYYNSNLEEKITYSEEYQKLFNMNIGSYAASKGYDAINAEGHGESGSYTVILNRTKVIIKGE